MVRQVISPREADIGGLIVRRSLPARTARTVGPWVFFDHMGPAKFSDGRGLDVIPHPHINLSTVTYLFEGEIVHRDSLGTVQTISPGAINMMVAGRGIVHSERTGPGLRAAGHVAHGLQLWLALPEEFEETEPCFYHYAVESIPGDSDTGVNFRVMIGEAFGLVSPVSTFSPTVFAEILLERNTRFEIPSTTAERALYAVSGEIKISGTALRAPAMAVVEKADGCMIEALIDSRVILIGGDSLGKRLMWWNFISSRKNRIETAIEEWREGKFGGIPDETERAPLPDSDSFSSMKE